MNEQPTLKPAPLCIPPKDVWPTLTAAQQTTICQTLVRICRHLALPQEKEGAHESARNAASEQ
jgi:hypothetical protein